ncbi:MAG TPA: hypothetical protein VE732_00235 [Nitrososphaera sp.]|jgi:hypothetical protein|nr:hypothetical protein [Nitrososphaera sp.]
MKWSIKIALLALLTVCIGVNQLPVPPDTALAEAQDSASSERRKALALLDEIIAGTRTLRLPENRALLQSEAADLLWSNDERRARALFTEAMDSLRETRSDGAARGEPEDVGPALTLGSLRRDVLEKVAARDLLLARDLQRSTSTDNVQPDDESQLELRLATAAASSVPQQAYRMAEESLTRGVSQQLPELLIKLQATDRDAAAKLMSDIVARLRSENLLDDEEASGIALRLLQIGSAAPAATNNGASLSSSLLDQTSAQALMETIVSAALQDSANSTDLLLALQSQMGIVEQYAPERAPLVRRKLAVMARAIAGTQRTSSETPTANENESAESLLGIAAKAPAGMRDALFEQAARLSLSEGQYTRARQIVEMMVDAEQRRELLEDLEHESLADDAKSGRVEQTLNSLSALPTAEERAQVLISLAKAITEKGDKVRALELLKQAREVLSGRARNFAQLDAQLQLACAFATLDARTGFEMMDSLIAHINELASSMLVVDGFITEDRYARSGELVLSSLTQFTDTILSENRKEIALATLAHNEFDRTKEALDRLERPELRLRAQLFVATSILTPQPATNLGN